jgi:hypothetical protein
MVYALAIAMSVPQIKRWEASENASVVVDGQPLRDTAWIRDSRVQVPMRAIFERLGATVQWLPGDRKVVATKGSDTITLVIGENFAYKNGAKLLDYPPRIRNGRVMVPLRFVSESLGARVRWSHNERTAFIDTVIVR